MKLHDSNKLKIQRDACGLFCHTVLAKLLTSFAATIISNACDSHNLTVNMQNLTTDSAAYNTLLNKLIILDHFNGCTFNTELLGAASCDRTWNMAV
ncbi:hypothetical protein [Methylomonas methanica]|uniref:Uncharacterized protein n=1 Tax=Methylomonas methanica (strain DSM 25384 / MC09) TaxID=857087 RepID=F9ZWN5_METMM|nr:hypothetical protein [Methylomonas methanica]AEG00882.1 hypothetical protein Metme_2488 [Methylomonas methanica MC09]